MAEVENKVERKVGYTSKAGQIILIRCLAGPVFLKLISDQITFHWN